LSSIATRHKLIKKIKDEKFDEDKLQRYVLLTQIGAKDFQAAVVDSDDNRLIFFEDFVFSEVNSPADLQLALEGLFESHEYLSAGFWKEVRISIKNNKFIQVPDGLFIPEAAGEYLRFNASIDPATESVRYCRNASQGVVTVFALPTDTVNWLNRIYTHTKVHLVHQSAALIEGVLAAAKPTENPLYIYVDRFKLHILFAPEGKLVYYNQFQVKQFSDYVKYIMLVMKSMGMNQETSQVVLWGYIGKNSPHYEEFVKYIRNVLFGDRPSHLKYGYLFDEIQDHHYFDLYSINLLAV
jgi:hypothetical protein